MLVGQAREFQDTYNYLGGAMLLVGFGITIRMKGLASFHTTIFRGHGMEHNDLGITGFKPRLVQSMSWSMHS